MRISITTGILGVVLTLGGCTPFYPNRASCRYEPDSGYRFESLKPGEKNTDDLFVCLTFSGGGTRAAAFAYGALLALDEVILPSDGDGEIKTLLDEVDVISSVSGGSFTAMAYGLSGKELFDGPFEREFLRRNIELDLLASLWKPKHLWRVPFVILDRSDVAGYYYNEEVFGGKTYDDLYQRGRRPFIVVNATDLSRRQRFAFTQGDFDLLGSDLRKLGVGWATAASSAFPILLSPMRFKYFHGDELDAAVKVATSDREGVVISTRLRRWAETLRETPVKGEPENAPKVDEDAHRFLYLLDGGLADNLGVSFLMESFRSGAIHRKLKSGDVNRLVVIVVDAEIDPPKDLERRALSPSLFTVGERIGTTGIHNLSRALTGSLKFALLEAHEKTRKAYDQCAHAVPENCECATAPALPTELAFEAFVIDLNFERIEDAEKRQSFLSILTRLVLPSDDVSELIKAGQTLLPKHPEYWRLMKSLEGP